MQALSDSINLQACERVRGVISHHRPVEDRGHGIDVCPGPLLTGTNVKLDGSVTRGEDGKRVMHRVANRQPRRSEIQQYRAVVGAQKYVARFDVTVQEAGPVDLLKPAQQWPDHGLQVILVGLRVLAQEAAQRAALFIAHHHVGGAIRLEITCHPDDIRVREACKRSRFRKKLVEAALVGECGVGIDRHHAAVERPQREVHGQVFLDRDTLVQNGIAREIGHAETPRAQNRFDPEFEQHGLEWKAMLLDVLLGDRLGHSTNSLTSDAKR